MTDREYAQIYHWFCREGYKHPILNDPNIIHGVATPEYITELMLAGMKKWPLRAQQVPTPSSPLVA